uniref:CCAAT enhancer binding protein delta n=1 Tax=Eptatretus burgeri TaxID=7764 RepID=A0A8C4N5P4_EPTBU
MVHVKLIGTNIKRLVTWLLYTASPSVRYDPGSCKLRRPGGFESSVGSGAQVTGNEVGANSSGGVSDFGEFYENESSIDLSAYIEPNLELCNDEYFADILAGGAKHDGKGFGFTSQQPPTHHDSQSESGVSGAPLRLQAAACAQTSVHLTTGTSGRATTPSPSTPRLKLKKEMDKGSLEYRIRRERNNIAVRKSRDKAKQRSVETQIRVQELAGENERLQRRVEQLSRQLSELRTLYGHLSEHANIGSSQRSTCC